MKNCVLCTVVPLLYTLHPFVQFLEYAQHGVVLAPSCVVCCRAAFRESHHAALAPGNSKGTAGDGLCDVDAKFSLSELSVPVDVCTMSALAGDFSVLPEFLSKL